jgi:hypothetical protein
VPQIEGNDEQLLLNNKTVTYNSAKSIRNAYSYPRLLKYIGKKNQWSKDKLATIDWEKYRDLYF